jgi:hypothetical protein
MICAEYLSVLFRGMVLTFGSLFDLIVMVESIVCCIAGEVFRHRLLWLHFMQGSIRYSSFSLHMHCTSRTSSFSFRT